MCKWRNWYVKNWLFTDFVGLRQRVVKPYRVVYEATDTACNILGVMRASRLIGISNLGSV